MYQQYDSKYTQRLGDPRLSDNLFYEHLNKSTLHTSNFESERVKSQILSNVKNQEARHYIEQKILKDLNCEYHVLQGSSIYHKKMKINLEKYSTVKGTLKHVEVIIAKDIAKHHQQIKKLQHQAKLLSIQNKSLLYPDIDIQKHLSINYTKGEMSDLSNQVYHKNTINKTLESQKQLSALKLQKVKEKLRKIGLIKKDSSQLNTLLENKKKQYNKYMSRIDQVKRISNNIQPLHPNYSELQLRVQELQAQYDRKSILLDPRRLKMVTQILQDKLENKGHYKEGVNTNKSIFLYEKGYGGLEQLSRKKQQLQNFMSKQQQDKSLLFQEIQEFNNKFQQKKKANKNLKQLLKQELNYNSQLIDNLVKYQYDKSITWKQLISNNRESQLADKFKEDLVTSLIEKISK